MDADWLIIKGFLAGAGAGFVLGWLAAWLGVLGHHTSAADQTHFSTGDET